MPDTYPQNFPIEIERLKLCRYLRAQAILSWSTLVAVSSVLGAVARTGKRNAPNLNSVAEVWREFLLGLGIGAAVGLLIACLLYLVFNHFSAKRIADSLQVSVEGQYLRVVERALIHRDRKLHFRAIVDYACFQGPLMRYCGITGITMHTMAGGYGAVVNILAVKDAPKIRDMLSDIDRLREDLSPA